MKTSFEPLPKEARLTAISARIAPIPPDPPPSGVLGKTPHLRGFVFVDECAAARPGRSLDWLKFKKLTVRKSGIQARHLYISARKRSGLRHAGKIAYPV